MVGMAAGLCYLEVKDNQRVKEYVSKHLRLLNLLACICFAALILISFANEQVILHSVVYMPVGVILLIIIVLTGGALQMPLLQKFGAISFAFFLVHQMCIRYLQAVLGKLGYDSVFILATLAFIITVFVSYFLTYTFDKKTSSWLKKKLLNRQSMTVQS